MSQYGTKLDGSTVSVVNGSPTVVISGIPAGTVTLPVTNGSLFTLTGSNVPYVVASGGGSAVSAGQGVLTLSSNYGGTVASTTGMMCSFATNVMTLNTAPSTGALAIGQQISAAGVAAGTYVTGLLTGTLNVSGSTYSLSTTPGTISNESTTAYASGQLYNVTTSYTTNNGIPYMEQGDIDTQTIFKRAMMLIDGGLNYLLCKAFGTAITTVAASTYTVDSGTYKDHTIIQTTTASTYTLPSAASYTGRELHLVTQFAGAVSSGVANVVPLAGGSATTTILVATAGKWATLKSNGTNWVIVASN